MALSNIFKEPRREITETGVGIGVVFALFAADYSFGYWLYQMTIDNPKGPIPVYIGMIFGIIFLVFVCVILAGVHAIGDSICGYLERNGIQMRPKNRP